MEDRDKTVIWNKESDRSIQRGEPARRVSEPVQSQGPVVNVNQQQPGSRPVYPVWRPSPARAAVWKAQHAIYYIFGVIEAIIAIRFILKLVAANPNNAFAQLVYNVGWVFVFPFYGLVPTLQQGGSILELFSLVAIVIYALVSFGIVKLLDLAVV